MTTGMVEDVLGNNREACFPLEGDGENVIVEAVVWCRSVVVGQRQASKLCEERRQALGDKGRARGLQGFHAFGAMVVVDVGGKTIEVGMIHKFSS